MRNVHIVDIYDIRRLSKKEAKMPWRYPHPSFHGREHTTLGWWTFVLKGQGPLAAALILNVMWFVILAWSVSLIVSGLK